MNKNTKINLVLGFWLSLAIWGVIATYQGNLGYGLRDAFLMACFPAIPTLALAIVLSVRLTK